MTKCYTCEFRGDVVGSAHSYCKHPDLEGVGSDLFAASFGFSRNRETTMKVLLVATRLNVKGNDVGIKNGWFV